jgi:hypothetical protein
MTRWNNGRRASPREKEKMNYQIGVGREACQLIDLKESKGTFLRKEKMVILGCINWSYDNLFT